MRNRIRIASATFLALSTMVSAALADDETISVKNLPAAVKTAIKKKFHGAEIEKATKEVEDGKTTYEVLLELEDEPVEVAFKADGTILEIEKKIPFEKLPARVKKALAARYPNAKIEKVELITKGEHGPELYEIAIKTEVVVTAKGEFVQAKDEADEKPSAQERKSKKDDDDDEDDDEDDDDDDDDDDETGRE